MYLKGRLIPEADPVTFQTIDAPYAKDAEYVYCGTVWIPEAEPGSFVVMRTGTQWVESHQIDSFVATNGDQFEGLQVPVIFSGGRWARDDRFHYRDAARVVDADHETFRTTDDQWGRDKNGKFKGPFREELYLQRISRPMDVQREPD